MDRTVGTLVVRAWVEADVGPKDLRARVLAITGQGSDMQEVGVAAGMQEILELVEEGLRTVVPLGEGKQSS